MVEVPSKYVCGGWICKRANKEKDSQSETGERGKGNGLDGIGSVRCGTVRYGTVRWESEKIK